MKENFDDLLKKLKECEICKEKFKKIKLKTHTNIDLCVALV